MKRLLTILILSASAFATTTVTGKMQTLGTGNVANGSFVRFWLRGCGGNQPRITGTSIVAPTQGGAYYFDVIASTGGNVSGTLYSTRDAAGTGNGEIECGGSKTSVWYGMQAFTAGKGGPEVPVHAKNTATLDISSVTPITVNPVTTSPSGDTTYFRLDAGNSPITGATTFAANLFANQNVTVSGTSTHNGATNINGLLGVNNVQTNTNVGVYTNTQMNEYLQSLLNCTPSGEFHNIFAGYATEAVSGANCAPIGSTVFQATGGGFYATTSNATTAAVGVQAMARNTVGATASATGINAIGSDGGVGNPGVNIYGGQFDCNAFNTGTGCHGVLAGSFFSVQPTQAIGFELQAPQGGSGTNVWTEGYRCDLGSTAAPSGSGGCLSMLPVAAGVNQPSQGIVGVAADTVSGTNIFTLNELANGSVNLSMTKAGAVFIAPGLQSTVATGTAPIIVASTTPVSNLTPQRCSNCLLVTGVSPDASGAKHKRFGATCSTTNVVGNTCTTTYSWTTAFADASYTPVCWGVGPTGSPLLALNVTQIAASITVIVEAVTANISTFAGVDCVAMHD